MLYYNFQNYEGFQERFGIVEHGNGEKSRRNKVLLSFIKQPRLLREARESGDYTLLNIPNMVELKKELWDRIIRSSTSSGELMYPNRLIGYCLYSRIYQTDEMNGICEDGDFKSVRYINKESGRVFKMKAGKFIRALILETEFGQTLPEPVLIYLQEAFVQDWQVYCQSKVPENKLYVNKEFGRIYSGRECEGDFHSCMTSQGYHYFYKDAVNASAAYLENKEGKVIARCVIYNECIDEDGNVWRLAERQYSTNCNDVLKRALVDALIQGGYIDGYKQVGYDCHNSRGFVDLKGNSLENKKFHINCDLGEDDTLSYQDSFKWYDIRNGIAYNYEHERYDFCLDTTEGSIYGNDDDDDNVYDSYHDRYCYAVVDVIVNGQCETCDEDDLDDFVWVEKYQRYYHSDDVSYCCKCGSPMIDADIISSDITDEEYCCDECLKAAELEYAKCNWTFAEYDQKYYENADSVATFLSWNSDTATYDVRTIAKRTLTKLLNTFRFLMMGDGKVYDQINYATWMPFEEAVA